MSGDYYEYYKDFKSYNPTALEIVGGIDDVNLVEVTLGNDLEDDPILMIGGGISASTVENELLEMIDDMSYQPDFKLVKTTKKHRSKRTGSNDNARMSPVKFSELESDPGLTEFKTAMQSVKSVQGSELDEELIKNINEISDTEDTEGIEDTEDTKDTKDTENTSNSSDMTLETSEVTLANPQQAATINIKQSIVEFNTANSNEDTMTEEKYGTADQNKYQLVSLGEIQGVGNPRNNGQAGGSKSMIGSLDDNTNFILNSIERANDEHTASESDGNFNIKLSVI